MLGRWNPKIRLSGATNSGVLGTGLSTLKSGCAFHVTMSNRKLRRGITSVKQELYARKARVGMKKLITAVILGCIVLAGGAAQADLVTYEYSFSAADLMEYTIAEGTGGFTGNSYTGQSALASGVSDGARLLRNGTSGGLGSLRSYNASQNDAFEVWATTTTDRLMSFNLWGLDGKGMNWGEDYKLTSFEFIEAPTGWTSYQATWPTSWGTPPAGYNTLQMYGWSASNLAYGFNQSDTDLNSEKFTFRATFDTTDAFWGHLSSGVTPSLENDLVFWFGGNMYNSTATAYNIYEGNMELDGTQVPEPASMTMLGLGLAGMFVRSYRKRK